MNNLIEENIQKYQLNQDDKIYVFSTGLVGNNLRLSCYEYHENTPQEIAYSSIFTIDQLKRENQIFQIAKDCEDVQSIFEDVILAQSVGILEGEGYLDVYFYMALNGKRAKIILRLMWIKKTPPPPSRQLNEFQINQERLTRLQYNANQLLNEQNALRKQLNSFFEENAIEINQGITFIIKVIIYIIFYIFVSIIYILTIDIYIIFGFIFWFISKCIIIRFKIIMIKHFII